MQAARLAGITGVFDTDDGTAAGIYFREAQAFARWITTPGCFTQTYGAKHVLYPGYKQSAYLHPDQFTPDPQVRELLGVGPDEKYFILRFVNMEAGPDTHEAGMAWDTKRHIVDRLSSIGRVFISSEGKIP